MQSSRQASGHLIPLPLASVPKLCLDFDVKEIGNITDYRRREHLISRIAAGENDLGPRASKGERLVT